MKIAISTFGPSLDDRVDERFGRARFLLIVDELTGAVEVLDNAANQDALQGAGLGAAEKVLELGAGAVITGHLGPKAARVLHSAGVEGYAGTGLTAREALEARLSAPLARLNEGSSLKSP